MLLASPLGLLGSLAGLLLLLPSAPGSQLYGAKRGRPQYSSLIPFPRVGRSGEYYGQKRGGKSGLIPFPRVGKRAGPGSRWPDQWPLLTILPRIGRGGAEDTGPAGEGVELVELATVPSKRQSLIPFPRVGRSLQPARAAFHRRLLRSASNEFKRRITRSPASAFGRRILRAAGQAPFRRRITRAGPGWATVAPERSVQKRQSLIPFPRTGKRSGASTAAPGEMERDQVYVYEGDEEDEGEAVAVEGLADEEEEGEGRGLGAARRARVAAWAARTGPSYDDY